MNAQALAVKEAPPANLRAFDIRRDLLAVADLVELCFKESLDADGRLYILQMRKTARSGKLLNLAAAATGRMHSPPGGFVWLESGELVGNLSLIPVYSQGISRYLIANVAVHPDFQRRGIARSLTQTAIAHAQRGRAREIWLQVDAANQHAQKLYRSMGFEQRAHRASWQARPDPDLALAGQARIKVRNQQKGDWQQHRRWLDELYPKLIRWNLPLDIKQFQPGWRGSFQRFIGEKQGQQWAAHIEGKLVGVLSWQSSSLHTDRLWFAASPKTEAEALPQLLSQAYLNLRTERSLVLNYPAGRGVSLFKKTGFNLVRSLIWMQYS